jgi:hypothetical protein
MTAEWRPIPLWEDSYSVSSDGRVRSLDRDIIRSDGHLLHATGRVLRQHHGSVILQRPGQRLHRCVRVLVQAAFGDKARAA